MVAGEGVVCGRGGGVGGGTESISVLMVGAGKKEGRRSSDSQPYCLSMHQAKNYWRERSGAERSLGQ